jgi:hypothetical protein
VNLPRGKLIDTLKGGPDVLRRLLAGLSGRDFNGYIKVDHQREDTEAHGVLILMGSRPVMALYIWKQRLFGQQSLRPILRDTLDEDCTLKVFTLPDEARAEMITAVTKFSAARIDIMAFDFEKETRLFLGDGVVDGAGPHGGAGDGPEARTSKTETAPPAPARPEEAAALYSSIHQLGIDTSDLKRKEEELLRKEAQLRQDIEQGRKERDRLRTEEANFQRMDEALQKQIRQREGEKSDRESQLALRMTELQQQLDRRAEDIAAREQDMRTELERLSAEKEELKRREEKLLEMEKMFRRVLTNTEERLKRKEDDLLHKEEELEKVLRQRMREMEELHAQAAASGRAGQVPVEFQKIEEALKIKDGALRKRETELEERLQRFKEEVAEHERRKAELASAPAQAGAGPDSPVDADELRRLLASLDSLFDGLPPEAVERFANSPDFSLYEGLMLKLGLAKK